jgi:hypothetical protein
MRGFLRIAELYKEVRPALGGEHGAPCRIKALAVIPGAVPVFSPCWAAGRRGSIRLWKRRARSGLRCAGRASCRLPRGPVRRSPPGASRSPRCGGRCENCTTPAGRVGNATAGPADRAGEAEVAELRPHKLVLQVAALVEAEHAAPPPVRGKVLGELVAQILAQANVGRRLALLVANPRGRLLDPHVFVLEVQRRAEAHANVRR